MIYLLLNTAQTNLNYSYLPSFPTALTIILEAVKLKIFSYKLIICIGVCSQALSKNMKVNA